jgi:hypothetical protein
MPGSIEYYNTFIDMGCYFCRDITSINRFNKIMLLLIVLIGNTVCLIEDAKNRGMVTMEQKTGNLNSQN